MAKGHFVGNWLPVRSAGFSHLCGVELEASEERILPASLWLRLVGDRGEHGQIRSKEKAQLWAAPL